MCRNVCDWDYLVDYRMRRFHSTDSENSIIQSPKRACVEGSETSIVDEDSGDSVDSMCDNNSPATLEEVRTLLRELKNGQESFRKTIDEKFVSFTSQVTDKIDSLKDDLYMELGRLNNQVTRIEERIQALEDREDKRADFDVDTTVVVINMKEEREENVSEKCAQLIECGLGLRDIKPVQCKRLPGRDGKPGVVKVQLRTRQDKINVLQHKGELSKTQAYKRVYIRSSQTHEERLMRLNLQTLMNDLPNGNNYRFTGNGRLIKKTDEGQGSQQQQHERQQQQHERQQQQQQQQRQQQQQQQSNRGGNSRQS